MKLSIITTVYNAAPYLKQSLDSVFNQTFKDFELILVNDGSTDESKDIMLKYLHLPNVRLLENTYNEGIPTSRNRALLAAKGDYVAIHDGDDISFPERFQREVDYLDEHKDITFLGSYAIKINHNGDTTGSMVYPPKTTPEAFMLINKFKLNPIIDSSCMYRKAAIIKNGGYTMEEDLRTALDFHLWCRLLSQGYKLTNIQEPLIYYRVNPKGVTRTENDKMVEATDAIVATLGRRTFSKITLRSDRFEQDIYTEVDNYIKNGNGD